MKRAIGWIIIIVCAIGFILAAAKLGSIVYEYWKAKDLYEQMVSQMVTVSVPEQSGAAAAVAEGQEEPAEDVPLTPPISVDFNTLRAINSDVVGWIYCEGTIINYPVVQGDDNNYYLHHTFDGMSSGSASIFVDSYNRRDFQDANSIIYGHHMKNGTMFACIEGYCEQEYYDQHPVMWLLTPERNYCVRLFSGYTTAADSDTYRIYDKPGKPLDTYIQEALAQSDFQAKDVEFTGQDKLVVLSTCAYEYNDARYVVHGILQPVD